MLVNREEREGALSEIEQEALIQRFEYTHELAWKVVKDFMNHRFAIQTKGPKDTMKAAFKAELVQMGEVWLDMIEKRNLTVHTYNEAVAVQVVEAVVLEFFPQFIKLESTLSSELSNES